MTWLLAGVIFWLLCCLVSLFDKTPTELTQVHDGYEYERYCAFKLEEAGWYCEVTQASGDQGVDVIAEKDGCRVAIQCKFYKSAVGNKAVQEAIAGAIYYKARFSVVIVSSRYTDSAYELGQAANVLLITHDDIPKMERLLLEM